MPPMAAAIGSAARVGSRRSPATNSRLSSSPTTKKKIANRPSAAHADTDNRRCSDSGPIANSETARYAPDHGELAHSRAAPAANQQQHPADGLLPKDLGEPLRFRPRAAREESQIGRHWPKFSDPGRTSNRVARLCHLRHLYGWSA